VRQWLSGFLLLIKQPRPNVNNVSIREVIDVNAAVNVVVVGGWI
jgi:hypothetical protein